MGRNEALFREVNEEIQGINRSFRGVDTMGVLCECGSPTCADQLEIGIADYQRVRSDSRLFIIVPGHEIPEFETVIERTARYSVVQKHAGVASDVAEETDPRS